MNARFKTALAIARSSRRSQATADRSIRRGAQLINQTSGKVEYYTPPEILAAARRLMGAIELDPFSSVAANERVRAHRIFTLADDGFAQEWKCATLWMNHPFGKDTNRRAIDKLAGECAAGNITRHALCLTYACTSEAWFRPLLARPQCFLCPRTNYYLPNGKKKNGVTKGSVVTYFGDDVAAFAREFSALGEVKVHFSHSP